MTVVPNSGRSPNRWEDPGFRVLALHSYDPQRALTANYCKQVTGSSSWDRYPITER